MNLNEKGAPVESGGSSHCQNHQNTGWVGEWCSCLPAGAGPRCGMSGRAIGGASGTTAM